MGCEVRVQRERSELRGVRHPEADAGQQSRGPTHRGGCGESPVQSGRAHPRNSQGALREHPFPALSLPASRAGDAVAVLRVLAPGRQEAGERPHQRQDERGRRGRGTCSHTSQAFLRGLLRGQNKNKL